MDRIRIRGGHRLEGEIPISGAKNAALPLMIAGLLTDETLSLRKVPQLADVTLLMRILSNHGVDIRVDGKRQGVGSFSGDTMHMTARSIVDTTAPYDFVSRMRASFWVLGPLLARCRQARVSMPGGCAIGTRPVDLHLMAMEKLGAEIAIDGGYVVGHAPNGLVGNHIAFPKTSVGATHAALMAAVLARGETIIDNAAREPEVGDLAQCLVKMGARIEGIGASRLVVSGVSRLHGATHDVLPDRIEAGTYAMAVAMAGGEVELLGARGDLLDSVTGVLDAAGAQVGLGDRGLKIARNGTNLAPVAIDTRPYPGFPTDLQAQLMALTTRAQGTSTITETIFENRFMHVQELVRLGADITLDGDTATVRGVKSLRGAEVMATDLRASVCLVIAGLVADGETLIHRVYHLDRGFERFEKKLSDCGADIERVGA
ncbi:MAG: UDP-N-acetylglucosamine 1-carboxyvinyltransferase [Hyphomicrobiales bacterium]